MFEEFKENFSRVLSKPILKKEGGATFRKSGDSWVLETNYSTTKLLGDSEKLEKGKQAQIGEVREWKGQKYRKDASGQWVIVTSDRHSGADSEEAHKKRGFDKDSGDEDITGQSENLLSKLSEEQVSEYSRSAKTESLKRHSEGGDERMRVAAKAELSRREKEENPETKEVDKADGQGGTESLKEGQENKEKGGEISIEQKTEKLTSDYRGIVEKLMDPSVFSKPKEVDSLTSKQQETARYLLRIKDFEGVDQVKAQEEILKKLNLTTDTELKDFIGDGKILSMKKSFNFLSFLTEDCYYQGTYSGKSVHMDELILDIDLEKGKGKGTEIFSNQVTKLKDLGYKDIELTAAKSNIYNGYYTWAMLGFEVSSKIELEDFKSLVRNTKNPRIQNCRKLSELVSFKEGAEFWKKNGFQFEGKFDISEKSNSMKLLNNYIEKRKQIA
jgi:hypothetical protein